MNTIFWRNYHKVTTTFKEILGLDFRSLALLRIIFSCWFIAHLIIRFIEFSNSYNFIKLFTNSSVTQFLNSEYFLVYILFSLSLLFALLLLIGYRTTWASIACWGTLITWQINPLFAEANNILKIIALWGMFLPLGAAYSFDSALNISSKPLPKNIVSVATIGLTWQLLTIYHAPSIKLLLIGCLWLFPWQTSFWRSVIIVYSILVNFNEIPYFYSALYLVFVPSAIWDFGYKKVHTQKIAKLTINYDKDCGFCKKVVYLLRTILVLPNASLLEAQDNLSVYEDMQKYNSWVVEDYQGNRYYKWCGIVYIVSISPILWWLAPVLKLKLLMVAGNKVYETIANNRRFMGNLTKPFSFHSFSVNFSLLYNLLILFVLLLSRYFDIQRLALLNR